MSSVFEQVKKTIEKYNMLAVNDIVLVGVSGGPDSVALLHILYSLRLLYNLKLYVVHVNHMFRGDEAKIEAEFVAKLAQGWGLDYRIFEKNVPALMQKKGLSPQDAGHQVRKQIFSDLRQEFDATKLALGHHADDRAETVLLHLIQGTGLDGLASMPPVNDWIIRPLAQVSKKDIINYCVENKLSYCLDPSNQKAVYLRNKIRLQLLPYLKEEYNPRMVGTLNKLEDIVFVENNYLDEQVEKILKKVLIKEERGKLKVSIEELTKQHLAVQRRLIRKLYKLLKPGEQNLGYTHVEKVIEISKSKEGAKDSNLPNNILVRKGYEYLEILDLEKVSPCKQEEFSFTWQIPGKLVIPTLGILLKAYCTDIMPGNIPKDFTKIVLDGHKISSPLVVRQRKPGDRIQPLGMQGTKKIKDIFIDLKIEKEKRNAIPVICWEGEIIWLPGITMNEKYKVTSGTKCYLNLELVKGEYV
ncbi:MAG: tRNA(Ile)-lysidine synthase [Clostridia bacterium]|jgi:tRNA(Ile)-lysidine synthase|nr:tRNA(Ile)-lysidine synthase [Clostridia bacterium]MDN5321665.1 tRNA(Ile)-lysidine synthase [Clostridia bacterium]